MNQRSIKFRVWDRSENTMTLWDGILKHIRLVGEAVSLYFGNDQEMIMMQYTGLTDKHGKEVYEGDIRQFKNGIGTIIWEDAAFAVKSPSSEAVDWEHSSVLIDSEYLGNIYEHPDLLTNLIYI